MRFGEGYGDNGSGYGEAAAGGDCGEAAAVRRLNERRRESVKLVSNLSLFTKRR